LEGVQGIYHKDKAKVSYCSTKTNMVGGHITCLTALELPKSEIQVVTPKYNYINWFEQLQCFSDNLMHLNSVNDYQHGSLLRNQHFTDLLHLGHKGE
jgi:hypothetical protein